MKTTPSFRISFFSNCVTFMTNKCIQRKEKNDSCVNVCQGYNTLIMASNTLQSLEGSGNLC